jgi:choline dehydrogenase-like flavoprotein
MLAAALDPNCPWRGNEMLGRRFQDHLGGRIASIIPKDRKALDRIFATVHWQRNKFQPKVRLARSCIEDKQVLGALGMVTFESSVSENLNFLKQFLKAAIHSRRVRGIGSFFTHTASCAKHLPPLMFAYLKDHRVLSPANSSISLVVQAEQCPLDDSRILVDRQAMDVHGLPAAVLDWRLGNAELRSIRELALQCDLGFREAGLGSLDIDPDLLDCNPRMLDKLRDTNHSAGGCIMSASPATGVVDPTLKVYGTSNTYVAGASVFPTSSDANVTFTAMALACRLADRLTGEHAA